MTAMEEDGSRCKNFTSREKDSMGSQNATSKKTESDKDILTYDVNNSVRSKNLTSRNGVENLAGSQIVTSCEKEHKNTMGSNNLTSCNYDEKSNSILTQIVNKSSEAQNATSYKWVKGFATGGRTYLPYAFTEQGVYMLMTILHGELATQQSRALVIIFKKMKDYIYMKIEVYFKTLMSILNPDLRNKIKRLKTSSMI